jgi:hypothetical protein
MSLLDTTEATTVSTEATEATTEAPVSQEIQTNEVPVKEAVQQKFLDLLGDEFKEVKALQSFKDVNDLAKSYLHANSLLGKRLSDMKPEDVAILNNLRNVPSSEDDYKFAEDVNEDLAAVYKKISLKAGLTKDQAKVIADSFVEIQRAEQERMTSDLNQNLTNWHNELKAEFGDAYEKRLDIAKRGLNTFGDDGLKELLKETGLHQHPAMVKLFAKVGKELLEDSFIEADKVSKFGVTPEDANAMIKKNLADIEFRSAYFSAVHPEHAKAVEEMNKLYSLLAPKK